MYEKKVSTLMFHWCSGHVSNAIIKFCFLLISRDLTSIYYGKYCIKTMHALKVLRTLFINPLATMLFTTDTNIVCIPKDLANMS